MSQIPPEFDPSYDPNTGLQNGFLFPHRAFRRMWMTVVSKIDTTDWADQEEVKDLIVLTKLACESYAEHNELETKHFVSALEPHEPELAKRWLDEHVHHLQELKDIEETVTHLAEISDNVQRRKEGMRFADKMHLFLASDLQHMSFEENEISDIINKRFDANFVRDIEERIIRELNPAFLRSISPFFLLGGDTNTVVFLAHIVHAQTAQAPPQAWAGFCQLAKSILNPKAFAKAQSRFPDLDGTRR